MSLFQAVTAAKWRNNNGIKMAILDDIDRELMGMPPKVSDDDLLMGAMDGMPASQVLGPADMPPAEMESPESTSGDLSKRDARDLSRMHHDAVREYMKAYRGERAAGNRNPLGGAAVVAAKERMADLENALADKGFMLGRKPPRGSR